MSNAVETGRFAPTPSGHLHAGNLLCALIAYLSVKHSGGRFIVRIEDLDVLRCPASSAANITDMLDSLGLKSDAPPVWQSRRTDAYKHAEAIIRNSGSAKLYPCFCSRAELHAAHAPRLSDGAVVYSGACKNLSDAQIQALSAHRAPCVRISVPDEVITFNDGIKGMQSQNLKKDCGDFIIRRSDGVYAYQLAVVTDDGESGVTQVVRGDDLLSSTPRQIYLQRLLDLPTPRYYHIPLVCAKDGRKLSKTDGDRADRLFDKFAPETILGGLAYAAGITDMLRPASLDELTEIFDWKKVKRETIVLPF